MDYRENMKLTFNRICKQHWVVETSVTKQWREDNKVQPRNRDCISLTRPYITERGVIKRNYIL